MELKLLLVTQSGSVNDLYSLIRADPNILHNVDVLPFSHTPLHEASSAGKIDLAMELMVLNPCFAKKLNENGFSPLHLAVENEQVELALELVKFDPSLVRIRGKGGITPFHLVAKKGDVELLTKFLQACPESIKDADVNGETALHMTVMNDRYEELKVLTGWIQRRTNKDGALTEIDVLNRCDRNGNTALHLAAYENNDKAIKQLIKCMSLDRNIQNKSGKTALDVLRANGSQMNKDTETIIKDSGGIPGVSIQEVEKTSVFLRKRVTFKEYCKTRMARYRSGLPDGSRNALLVITALIITATYETAVDREDKAKIVDKVNRQDDWFEIVLLWGFNTIGFCAATVLTFILLPVGRAYEWWYFVIMGPLVCSVFASMYMKYVSKFFMFIYVMILFGFLVYSLVFYIKWRLSVHKKVRAPKIELISQDSKTMV